MELIGQGMKPAYDYYIKPYEHLFTKVILEEEDFKIIKKNARGIVAKKMREAQNFKDNTSMLKRWVTGWCGERVVEKHLELDFIDFSIGESYSYNQPDLLKAGYRVGVKTSNIEDFPLLKPPSPTYQPHPQIFVVKKSRDEFFVAGLGEPDVLNDSKNYTPYLVRSNAVRHKKAFFRFDLLKHNFKIQDLTKYCL